MAATALPTLEKAVGESLKRTHDTFLSNYGLALEDNEAR